jgi:hypothetical protein
MPNKEPDFLITNKKSTNFRVGTFLLVPYLPLKICTCMTKIRLLVLLGFCTLLACEDKPDTLFEAMSPGYTGVKFKNLLRETDEFNVLKYGYFYNGGGVAIGDVNNDGLAAISSAVVCI